VEIVSEKQRAALSEIAAPLLSWFKGKARVLPWREQPTPYRVWVSEIMLQQTRVEAVKPYFERFVAALPDVCSLAEADEETLLKLWEGLGYYNRVRNLQKAAQKIMDVYGGVIPADFSALLALPGIGRYTAGAISSIAYGKKHPAVDGNVLRVVTRLTACTEDIAKERTKRAIEDALSSCIPDEAGSFNQALMELGATVCLPKGAAHCGECPLRQLCLAFDQNCAALLPYKAPKRQRRIEDRTVLLLEKDGLFALCRRPEEGLLAGLWEFPNLKGRLSQTAVRRALEELGLRPIAFDALPPAKHIFSHIEWHMIGWHIRLESGEARPARMARENAAVYAPRFSSPFHWIKPAELAERYAIPSSFQAYRPLPAKK